MLLQALMAARKTAAPQSIFCPNPYTPTSTLVQAILRASPLMTELVIVREWLHDTAAQPSIPEATTGYWSFTKHMLTQSGNCAERGRGRRAGPRRDDQKWGSFSFQ